MRKITDIQVVTFMTLISILALIVCAYFAGQSYAERNTVPIPKDMKRVLVLDLDKWECTVKRLNGKCIEISIIDYPCIDVRGRKCVVEK